MENVKADDDAIARLLQAYYTEDVPTPRRQTKASIEDKDFDAEDYARGLAKRMSMSQLKEKRDSLKDDIVELEAKMESTLNASFLAFDSISKTLPLLSEAASNALRQTSHSADSTPSAPILEPMKMPLARLSSLFAKHSQVLTPLIEINNVIAERKQLLMVSERIKSALLMAQNVNQQEAPSSRGLEYVMETILEGVETLNLTTGSVRDDVLAECVTLGKETVVRAARQIMSRDASANRTLKMLEKMSQLGVDPGVIEDVTRVWLHTAVTSIPTKMEITADNITELIDTVQAVLFKTKDVLIGGGANPAEESVKAVGRLISVIVKQGASLIMGLANKGTDTLLKTSHILLTKMFTLLQALTDPLIIPQTRRPIVIDDKLTILKDSEWTELSELLPKLHPVPSSFNSAELFAEGWRMFCSSILSEFAKQGADKFENIFLAEIKPSFIMWKNCPLDPAKGAVYRLPSPPVGELTNFVNSRLKSIDTLLSLIVDVTPETPFNSRALAEAFDVALDTLTGIVKKILFKLCSECELAAFYCASLLVDFAHTEQCTGLRGITEQQSLFLDERGQRLQGSFLIASSELMEHGLAQVTNKTLFGLEGEFLNAAPRTLGTTIKSLALKLVLRILQLREVFNSQDESPLIGYEDSTVLCKEHIGMLPGRMDIIPSDVWLPSHTCTRVYIPPLMGDVFQLSFNKSLITNVLIQVLLRFKAAVPRLSSDLKGDVLIGLSVILTYLGKLIDLRPVEFVAETIITLFDSRTDSTDPDRGELFELLASQSFLASLL